jgi:hypothetical protein
MGTQRSMDELYRLLDAPAEATITIQSMQVNGWGRELIFHCVLQVYDAEVLSFILHLTDCREMQWRVYTHVAPDAENRLVEIKLGRDQHRSPARILTEAFGLVVFYGDLKVMRQTNTT